MSPDPTGTHRLSIAELRLSVADFPPHEAPRLASGIRRELARLEMDTGAAVNLGDLALLPLRRLPGETPEALARRMVRHLAKGISSAPRIAGGQS